MTINDQVLIFKTHNVDLSVRQVLLEINKIINLIESFSDCPSLVS